MKVAISTDGERVSAHFGRCPSFTLADVENNQVIKKEVIPNPGHQPGFLPEFLQERGVQYIIAGGMGHRARILFEEKGIHTMMGVSGRVDDVLEQFVQGRLEGGENTCIPESGKGYGLDKTICDHRE